jgi:TonB-linked SusC/RagA family outer membrane protein
MIPTKTISLRLLLLCAVWALSLAGSDAYAQTATIHGTILSLRTSAPAQGATITIVGRHRATTSDEAGRFTLEAAPGDVLEITMIGYQGKEVVIGKSTDITVSLVPSDRNLDDVVVIGYGKLKRKDVTGAISSITGDELRQTQPVTIDQALQGKVAGVMVQQVSGQPGGGVSVTVRGPSSISGANSPLWVIDGVIIPSPSDPGDGSNPLATLNPSEIESIDVLKDASATAIYGSQATNGVIIITTKRGKAGAPQISYDLYAGYQELPKRLPTVNLQQFADFINARASVWGFDSRPEFVNTKYLGQGTDWQGALFRKAPMSNQTITVSGGDARTQYLLSASYFDQQGIALGSDFKRSSVRLNLDNKTTNWLKVGTSLQLAHIDESVNATTSNVISTALSLTPDIPVKNPDGSWGGVTNPSGWVVPVANPVGLALLIKDAKSRNQVFGNAYAEIQFFKDLTLRNEVSGNFDFATENKFTPTYTFGNVVNGVNSSSYNYNQNFYTVIRNYLTYNHLFHENSVNAVLGHEAQLSSFQNVSATRSNYPSNDVQSISSGDATTALNGGATGSGPAQESYFGRINLGLFDKYLFTVNARDDGSSNFAPQNRWVTTYSGAFAWKLNHEKFLENVKDINDLKLRLGYGVTNNQNIPGNTYVTQLSSAANGLSGVAQFQYNLANPYVSWEKTKYSNLGLDGTLFNWKINFSADVYNRVTDGLLLKIPLPLYSGTTAGYSPGSMQAPYVNVGSMRNRGFDLRISSNNVSSRNFTWKTDLTISHNINRVLSLGGGGSSANLSQSLNNEIFEKTAVGQPIGEFYGYVYDGIFAKPGDFKTHALPVDQSGNPYPVSSLGGGIWYGDRKFKDLNGDGKVSTADMTFLGSPLPTYQFGFGNTFTYKNFDLNVFFTADLGNKVLNELDISQTYPGNNTNYFTSVLNYARLALINPNGSSSDINNVYVTNPNTSIVGLRNDNTNDNNRPSTLFIQNGSFLRCKNITLGYRLPESLLSKVALHSLRVYGTVTNPFIFTKYHGMDPEIGSWNPLQAGWDNGYYPQPRVFTLGLNVGFSK